MILTAVNMFSVPPAIIAETEKHLTRAGRRGLELFVLWSGVVEDSEFAVRTVHVPRQTSYQLEAGLMVRVEGDALHRLNAWLYKHKETLAIQVHSHPADAFHSDTDDAYPIVTAEGSISIVAASFCRAGLFSDSTAVYRLARDGWHQLDQPFAIFRVS